MARASASGRTASEPPFHVTFDPSERSLILYRLADAASSAWPQRAEAFGGTVVEMELVIPDGESVGPARCAVRTVRVGDALAPLAAFTLGGSDASLHAWALVSKLALEMIAAERLAPTLVRGEAGELRATWRAALRPQDTERADRIADAMPASANAVPTPDGSRWEPRTLVRAFLDAACDALAREAGSTEAHPRPSPGEQWGSRLARALTARDDAFTPTGFFERRVEADVREWTGTTLDGSPDGYRVAFRLCLPADPESDAPGDENWRIEYALQAADDPSLLLDAASVWESGDSVAPLGRRFPNAEAGLLRGLGRAARVFPPVARSLDDPAPTAATFTDDEAWTFLREAAPSLHEAGFAILLPSELTAEGRRRLRLRMRVEGSKQRPRSGLDSGLTEQALARFRWEAALGDKPLTPAEYAEIVAAKRPIVRVRGQWVLIDPAELSEIESLHGNTGTLTELEAAAAALTQTVDGRQVEVVAAGGMADLLERLRSATGPAEAEAPPGFVGTLRPYQARGLGWLQHLEAARLGGVLADDMGLGKCLAPHTPVFVNGAPIRLDDLWDEEAIEVTSTGEEEWATPRRDLSVNAIDAHGRIVSAQVSRLYRQYIDEDVRRIALDDGTEILATKRHKLLSRFEWTSDLNVGDFIAVPSRLRWDGMDLDPDLTKLIAWQLAEGSEDASGRLLITQKSLSRLDELRQTALRVGARFGIKMNRPSVVQGRNRAPHLAISSVGYRRFLECHGYIWGQRSRSKVIPRNIVSAGDETVRLFLREFFTAEGSVSTRMRVVEIASASAWLMQQLDDMLRRFGIWLRARPRGKSATNGQRIVRQYTVGVIGGASLRRYADEIGFSDPAKNERLALVCSKPVNTNVESIPAADLLRVAADATGLPQRHFGVGTVYFTGSQQLSRTSAAHALSASKQILSGESRGAYAAKGITRWSERVLRSYDGDLTEVRRLATALGTLLSREVHYCRIRAIQDISYRGWVYDLEVEGFHNFVAAGVLCHNTIQVIGLAEAARGRAPKRGGPTLVVCPTSVVGNWEREIAKFGPSLPVVRHHGPGRPKTAASLKKLLQPHSVVLTTYGLMRRDADMLQKIPWTRVVMDEAQNVKNPDAKQARAARSLPAPHRFALTGTPVENRLSDLWSIMQFANPGLLGSEREFRERYALPIERYEDADAAERLRSLVRPFLLRRVKTDPAIAADLPEKLETKTYCPLTPEQATLYQAALDEHLEAVEQSEGIARRGRVLALLTALKQICNHPALYLREKGPMSGRSGKLARLTEMLEEVVQEGDAALLFTQYASMGRLLVPHLEQSLGVEPLFLHGGTARTTRERMIDAFQSPDGPQIFVLSLKAGGTGLNLTRATHVFHFDRWWNPAVEDQATDRAYRIGQTRRVMAHALLVAGTLEERIDVLLERKRGLAESVVGKGEAWLTELSNDQLRELVALSGGDVEDLEP